MISYYYDVHTWAIGPYRFYDTIFTRFDGQLVCFYCNNIILEVRNGFVHRYVLILIFNIIYNNIIDTHSFGQTDVRIKRFIIFTRRSRS